MQSWSFDRRFCSFISEETSALAISWIACSHSKMICWSHEILLTSRHSLFRFKQHLDFVCLNSGSNWIHTSQYCCYWTCSEYIAYLLFRWNFHCCKSLASKTLPCIRHLFVAAPIAQSQSLSYLGSYLKLELLFWCIALHRLCCFGSVRRVFGNRIVGQGLTNRFGRHCMVNPSFDEFEKLLLIWAQCC